MKIAVIIPLMLMPTVTLAQNYQGMNRGDMQQMMQQAQKMQTCMQNVDQAQMKVLEQRSNQFQAELKALCAGGKRQAAQAKAISFGKEIANDPTMRTMRKCGEMMKGMMPKLPGMDTYQDQSNRHVCD